VGLGEVGVVGLMKRNEGQASLPTSKTIR